MKQMERHSERKVVLERGRRCLVICEIATFPCVVRRTENDVYCSWGRLQRLVKQGGAPHGGGTDSVHTRNSANVTPTLHITVTQVGLSLHYHSKLQMTRGLCGQELSSLSDAFIFYWVSSLS